jgi:menaquinone-dependent protoporphyrinogen oxidase
MTLLIANASKHGSTQGIAERIAEQLRQLGKDAEARPVDAIEDAGGYEAFVIGSAVYYGSWLKEATEWVHRNQAILAKLSVWLFSVGPLGTEVKDAEQQPKELAEFQQAIEAWVASIARDLR